MRCEWLPRASSTVSETREQHTALQRGTVLYVTIDFHVHFYTGRRTPSHSHWWARVFPYRGPVGASRTSTYQARVRFAWLYIGMRGMPGAIIGCLQKAEMRHILACCFCILLYEMRAQKVGQITIACPGACLGTFTQEIEDQKYRMMRFLGYI